MSRIAIVTGATSGFGKAIAQRLVAEGWDVVLTGRRQERLDALVAELGGLDRAFSLCFDIRDEQATRTALATSFWSTMPDWRSAMVRRRIAISRNGGR